MNTCISLNGADWRCKGYIGEDWSWRNAHQPGSHDRRGWLPATVPGSVQDDLWRAGAIPDPYFERNSLLIEWVPQRTWVYTKTFRVDDAMQGKRVQLVFKGVDYEAQFFLNGERLGDHCGMFTAAVFEAGELLRYGEENFLAIVLEPAPYEEPQVGRTSRVRTHKTRMNYWWDFCPRMVHLGIWDDVYLNVTGLARIEDLFVQPLLGKDITHGEVVAALEVSTIITGEAEIVAELSDRGEPVATRRVLATLPAGRSAVEVRLEVDRPRLWWPNGEGEPALYDLSLRIAMKENQIASQKPGEEMPAGPAVSDRRDMKIGFRRVEFAQNSPAEENTLPYTLVVNGRRIFIKGWNWVPMDVLYGVERPAKLSRLLRLAQEANVNLLRVWGGGLIEKDAFYETCSRMGILVWQEFIQSSSGIENCPSSESEFFASLAAGAEQIVRSKRNHTSLALWCGGNELQTEAGQPLDSRHPALAALRQVAERLDPGRGWLPTSPSGPVFGFSVESIHRDPSALHDVHGPWEHQGLEGQFQLYNRGASRLHSEFGVEGVTNRRTLNAVIAREHQQPASLDNPVWEHLGAWWVKESTWGQMLGYPPDFDQLLQGVRFLQASGLGYAVEADRRRWPRNAGTLPWQFNEPYPMAACTSAVDYYACPKPAYYAVKRAYAPLAVTASFPRQAWRGAVAFEAQVWATNGTLEGFDGASLEASLMGATGRVYASQQSGASLAAGSSSRLSALNWLLGVLDEDVFILDLRLSGLDGRLLAANRYLFSRTEDLAPLFRVAQTELQVSRKEAGNTWELSVLNTGRHAALNVWLQDVQPLVTEGYVYFSDNYFSLLPGESRLITARWENVPPAARRLSMKGWNTLEWTD